MLTRPQSYSRPAVVFVLPSLNGGGAERATLNLHHHSKHTTKILVERREGDLLGDPMARDAIIINQSRGIGRAKRVVALARILRRLRPAVVVAVLSPLTAALAARSTRSRVMFWLQAPPYFMPGIRAERQSLVGRSGLWTLALLADVVAGAAPGLSRDWTNAGVPSQKLTVLPNGLELPIAVPQRRALPTDSSPLRILTMGRLAPEKRHDILIRALVDIRRERPADLTILGRGDTERDLRALAESLGVVNHTHFAGFVADPAAYLTAADLFVLASDFEGFGNVIVEALGYGLPVVCTDAPYGPRFIAGDCRAVRLVPLRDPSAIAREVLSVARHASPTWSAEAHARALEFSTTRVCAHFDLLIDSLIRGQQLPAWQDR